MIDVDGKRHVASPAAMDKYYFNWKRIVQIPAVIVDRIPNGPVLK